MRTTRFPVRSAWRSTGKREYAGRETQLYEQALRRIRTGKCYYQPCLGMREFAAYFEESDAPDVSEMKFVHWYDRDVPVDPLVESGDFLWDDTDEGGEAEAPSPQELLQRERDAVHAANTLVESGAAVYPITDTQYHILLLTGVGGRVMVRRYERGSYTQLTEHLQQWQEDLRLTNPSGTGKLKHVKLNFRLFRLLSYQKVDRKPFDRLRKELAGTTTPVLLAILGGRAVMLPDSVAVRALAFIRSRLLADADDPDRKAAPALDGFACRWLKVWLIRNKHKGDVLMSEYNPEYHGNAGTPVTKLLQIRPRGNIISSEEQ